MTSPSNIAPGSRYRVYITPLTKANTYGTELEVTDHIMIDGLNVIKRAIDSQDYEVGAYFYSDLELKGSNDNGYFNDYNDLRSIFPYLRDKAKVRIVFENTAGNNIVYYGLISEEATRIDALNEVITFRVLSRDSVIRNTQVSGGAISNGMSAKNAFLAILNNAVITSVLTVNSNNINPSINFTIDVGGAFDSMPGQDALTILLFASNSVMTIDSTGTVYIKGRSANADKSPLLLYGPYDIHNRQNVINIQNYNNGMQRMFTSVDVIDANNVGTVVDNVPLSEIYGYRQKSITLNFATEAATTLTIANGVLGEFAVPKIELEVEVPTSIAEGYDLLDRVSVDWPYKLTPITGKLMPVVGTATVGNANLPLPNMQGSLLITPSTAFKIIEIDEDPKTFTSLLKLRQIGISLSDGSFLDPNIAIVGFAIIDISKVSGTADASEMWNPSVTGSAVIGETNLI